MESTILKNVMDGDFSKFQDEMAAEIDSNIKEHLEVAKDGLPELVNQELGLSERGPEDDGDDNGGDDDNDKD
jgi:hypothetical protein